MKHILCFLAFVFCTTSQFAHDGHHHNTAFKQWQVPGENRMITGSFTLCKEGLVYILDAHDSLQVVSLNSLTESDQKWVMNRISIIERMHKPDLAYDTKQTSIAQMPAEPNIPYAAIATITIVLFFLLVNSRQYRITLPVLVAVFSIANIGFNRRFIMPVQLSTSPAFIDSAFTPFKPHVSTFWDTTYFYVESKGIPTTHGMMVGISNHGWQQQVPIPQCYIGNNAWPIPLNPVMAISPIPVDSIHFTRGAIAIAANGVPIFNVHTNSGVDAFLDGQLDNYGGHCGRADDYHYHTAPLHLYNHTPTSLPCAFGLDGFPVYGGVEPDGTAMQALDSNHAHFYGGTYHYHGTPAAPYMIARMAGEVTEDATHQLIPQAAAHPVRPSLTPLNGALITGCTPNASNNGYTLVYTRNGQTDSIVYSWNLSGLYTFDFYTNGNGIPTTQNYNGFVQCVVPTAINEPLSGSFAIYPNPGNGNLNVKLERGLTSDDVLGVSVLDIRGRCFIQRMKYQATMDFSGLPAGVYILQLELKQGMLSRKFIVGY